MINCIKPPYNYSNVYSIIAHFFAIKKTAHKMGGQIGKGVYIFFSFWRSIFPDAITGKLSRKVISAGS